MRRAPSSALRSKYSHHSPALPANATANAAISAALPPWPVASRPANVAPMMTMDSPRAIRMKA